MVEYRWLWNPLHCLPSWDWSILKGLIAAPSKGELGPDPAMYIKSQTTKAHMFSSAWKKFFWHQSDFRFGHKALKNIRKWLQLIFPMAFWELPNFEPKKNHFIRFHAFPLWQFLATCYVRTITMTTYKTRCGGLAWGWHWRRAMSARLLFIVPQIIMYCHRFILNGSFCIFIYARNCNNFVILTQRSSSGIKRSWLHIFRYF